MLARIAALAATLAAFASPAGAQVKHPKLVARVDSVARQAVAAAKGAGLSIAIARGKEILVAKGYGYARVEDRTAATPETIYPIASITKQFTAAAIMTLVESGRVRIKDDLSKYLPDFPAGKRKVTIQELLNHTSGIADDPDSSNAWQSALDLTPAEFIATLPERPFRFAPGESWDYSNSGYYLLGLVIEKVSGQTFGDFAGQHLLAPAGMTSSAYCPSDEAGRASGYDVVGDTLVRTNPIRDGQLFAAAGLCSTVLDLVKWQRALKEWKAVNGLSWKQMIEPAELKDGSRASYGYGVMIGHLGKHRWLGHGGSIHGFSSQLSFYPDDDLTVVVLSNSEQTLTRRIGDRIAGFVLGIVEPAVKDLPLPPAAGARFAGVYNLGGRRLKVLMEGDKLMLQIGTATGIRLLYQGSNEFVTEADPTTKVYFRTGQGGQARSLIFSAGDLTLNAVRRDEDGK